MEQVNRSSRWKMLLWIVLASIALFGLARIYFRATDDFRIANITNDIPNKPEWDVPALSAEESAAIHNILSQKFTYIGKGAQSYAFGSEDQKYVLKFFKFKHLRPSFFDHWLPPIFGINEYQEKQLKRKTKKFMGLFDGYRLAYDVHKHDSGLIYIHLRPTHDWQQTVTVIDKIGLERKIDLDPIVFILQEKAKTNKVVIGDLLKNGDVAGAKTKFGQVIDLYLAEYQKGILDHDHGVMHNSGFVGERPIHLDVGKLHRDESMKQPAMAKQDITRILNKFDAWLTNNYPQYRQEIMRDLNDKVNR